MRSSTLRKMLVFSVLAVMALQACRKDDEAMLALPGISDQSFNEEFDSVDAAYDRGWRYINVSEPMGTGFWAQGMFNDPLVTGFPTPIPFNAFSSKGSYVGFIGTDFTSTSAAQGVISNWVISPVLTMQNGDLIQFYTRAPVYDIGGGDSTDFSNRLQVRLNLKNEGTNVGSGDDAGDFTRTVLDINPSYLEAHTDPSLADPSAFPIRWTKFEAKVGGLNGAVKGRFAFRYYVVDGGSNGLGSGVAIDSVAYIGKK